jgi:glycosyltransferase involved in cell wall biosynthesis
MNIANNKPTISLIVPVYKGGKEFLRTLGSISSASPAADEVIIVADGDNDDCYQLAQELGFQLIRLPQNQGQATARNKGAEQAQGDILFFVDADVEIYPDTVSQVQSFFQENPDFVALIVSYDLTPGASNLGNVLYYSEQQYRKHFELLKEKTYVNYTKSV